MLLIREFCKYTCILSAVVVLSTCKKYDEGGFVRQTRLHLFGGHKKGDSKTWKLKLYEVNGIDSTYLIQGANSIPDFYDKFVTFTLTDPKYIEIKVNTFCYVYGGSVDNVYKKLSLGMNAPVTHQDSMQCRTIQNSVYCVRNLLFPEYNQYAKNWDIKKLTSKEIILETNWSLKNSYKIVLTQ